MIVSLAILALTPAPGQAGQDVGGEWEVQYWFEPAYLSPRMDADSTSMLSIGDIDQDGVSDLAFVAVGANGSDGGLIAVSGATGAQIWSFGYLLDLGVQGTPSSSICKIPDLDGDSVCELVAGDRLASLVLGQANSGLVTVHSGRTGELLWSCSDADRYGDNLGEYVAGLGDLNGDGFAEIAIGADQDVHSNWSDVIHIFSGADFSLLHSITEPVLGQSRVFGAMSGLDQQIDANADGVPDLLVQVAAARCELICPVTGFVHYSISDCVVAKGPPVADSVSFEDLDGDGVPEIVSALGTADGVGCFSGSTGMPIWRREFVSGSSAGWCIESIPDQDGDSVEDLIVGAHLSNIQGYPGTGKIHFLSGDSGKRQRAVLSGVLGFSNERNFGISVSFDRESQILFVREGGTIPGSSPTSGPVLAMEFSPFLIADRSEVSASAGATVRFDIDFPIGRAGDFYALGVSGSGIGPVSLRGVEVPLAMDSWLRASIAGTLPDVFVQRVGVLDTNGDGVAFLVVAPNSLSSVVGSSFWFAAVCGTSRNQPSLSSIARRIEVVL